MKSFEAAGGYHVLLHGIVPPLLCEGEDFEGPRALHLHEPSETHAHDVSVLQFSKGDKLSA